MKKQIAIILAVLLGLSGITVIADNLINGTMEFNTEKIELSLEEAISLANTESLAGKTAEWNLESAEAAYKSNSNSADALDGAIAYYGALGKIDSSLGTNADSKMLDIMAEYAKDQKDKNYTSEIQAMKMEVTSLYFKTIQAGEMKEINAENLAVKKKLYEDTQKKFELGMVAKQEMLTAEYNYLNAQTSYESSVNAEKTAKMGLNMYLGYDVMQDLVLTDTLIQSDFVEVDLAVGIESALQNRNEIGGAKFALDIQQINMDKIRVRYPSSAPEYMKQKVAYETAKYNFDNSAKSVEMDVRNKYMDLIQKQHAVEAGQKSVEAAEEALRLSELTYDAGMIIMTDLQNVQAMALQAKLGLSSAILDYNLALDTYKAATNVGTTTIPIQ